MANVVVIDLNHFGGNGVGIGVNLDGGKAEEVVGEHFNDVVIVGAKVKARVGVRVTDSLNEDWRGRVGGRWGRGHWPNRRFWRPH